MAFKFLPLAICFSLWSWSWSSFLYTTERYLYILLVLTSDTSNCGGFCRPSSHWLLRWFALSITFLAFWMDPIFQLVVFSVVNKIWRVMIPCACILYSNANIKDNAWILGEHSFLFRTLTYLSIFDYFNWQLILYLVLVWWLRPGSLSSIGINWNFISSIDIVLIDIYCGSLDTFLPLFLYLISVKYHLLLGISSPKLIFVVLIGILFSIGVLSIICCVDLIPFDITPHVLMCYGINHLLICFLSQSCVDLDLDITWTTFSCHTLVCLLVYLVFLSKLYLLWFYKAFACSVTNLYYFSMLIFLDPIYRGYSTKS